MMNDKVTNEEVKETEEIKEEGSLPEAAREPEEDGEKPSETQEPCEADEEESEPEVDESTGPENKGEPAIFGQKALSGANRFFLAALFPLVFILVLGLILWISGMGKDAKKEVDLTGKSFPSAFEGVYEVKPDEVRGVYVATVYNINYPSATGLGAAELKAELDELILNCAENGLNAIYFQASPCSDALYDSDILPTSSVLTGTEGAPLTEGFDPLAYLCEKAHKADIKVHAWVNPMRITAGSLDYDDLSADNPAVTHPEYTVEYNGELYYDLGVPGARSLQASVCAELAEKYPIDGVLFDDYYYPYPVEGVNFDDAATYEQYGKEFGNVEDFRRASVTAFIGECYDAIKAVRSDCLFGVAPFGIWRHDDGSNGGSNTRGIESYDSLYCDSVGFIRSGKLDYIAPQLYWTFESPNGPYGELCDWWAEAVKGTDVKLYISHAAYRSAEWDDPDEFSRQIEYARKKQVYYGSIYYGYAAIVGNEGGITAALAQIYE